MYFCLQSVLIKKQREKQTNKQITKNPLGHEAPVQHGRDSYFPPVLLHSLYSWVLIKTFHKPLNSFPTCFASRSQHLISSLTKTVNYGRYIGPSFLIFTHPLIKTSQSPTVIQWEQ